MSARASNPLEYPDNGGAAFSRGGAWLATATDPLAAHYNPAAMATQKSGFELGLLFAYQSICFQRRNPGNAETGPRQGNLKTVGTTPRYIAVCNNTADQPRIIPSLGLVWRTTDSLLSGLRWYRPRRTAPRPESGRRSRTHGAPTARASGLPRRTGT